MKFRKLRWLVRLLLRSRDHDRAAHMEQIHKMKVARVENKSAARDARRVVTSLDRIFAPPSESDNGPR